MLIEFSVSNYLSIKEVITLSMVASNAVNIGLLCARADAFVALTRGATELEVQNAS